MNKVDIIIPTHAGREKYVQAILHSLENQTYKNFKVFISDNNPKASKRPSYTNASWSFPVKYHRNNENIGPKNNLKQLISWCDAEYIKPIMSDDLIAGNYLEIAIPILEDNKNLGLLFSRRTFIDSNGIPTSTANMHNYDLSPSSEVTSSAIIRDALLCYEWFPGEPSGMIFRNKQVNMDDYFKPFSPDLNNAYHGSWDLIFWLRLLEKNNAYYLNENLTFIRSHPERSINGTTSSILCYLDYYYFSVDSKNIGLIEKDTASYVSLETMRYLSQILLEPSWIQEPQSFMVLQYALDICNKIARMPNEECKNIWARELLHIHNNNLLTLIGNHIINASIHTSRPVYIYGAGGFLKKLLSKNDKMHGAIKGILVTNKTFSEETINGIPAIEFSKYLHNHKNIVIIASSYQDEISVNLRLHGMKDGCDFITFPSPP